MDMTHDTLACKRIWGAVLLQAVEDLFATKRSNSEMTVEQIRQSAEDYLFSERSDEAFKLLGVDPDSARVALLKRMGKI